MYQPNEFCTVHFDLTSNYNTNTFFLNENRTTVVARFSSAVASTPGQTRKERNIFPSGNRMSRLSRLSRFRSLNQIKFFQNTIWGNRKLRGHPKLFQPFDHPFIYVLISFQKQSWFQVKQTFCSLDEERDCALIRNNM